MTQLSSHQIPEEWIDDTPVSAGLQILRINDVWFGYSDEEKKDSLEFIRCYLLKNFEPLLALPPHVSESDFWLTSFEEFEDSAFNTHNFQKGRSPLDKYTYRVSKILDQVEDLAILHSCIPTKQGRRNIRERCRQLIENEFLSEYINHKRLADLSKDDEVCSAHRRKMREMMRHIEECARTWKKHSRAEKWKPRYEGLCSV